MISSGPSTICGKIEKGKLVVQNYRLLPMKESLLRIEKSLSKLLKNFNVRVLCMYIKGICMNSTDFPMLNSLLTDSDI